MTLEHNDKTDCIETEADKLRQEAKTRLNKISGIPTCNIPMMI